MDHIYTNIFEILDIQFWFLNILRSIYKNSSNAKKKKKSSTLWVENLILKLCVENIENYMRKLVSLTHHLL